MDLFGYSRRFIYPIIFGVYGIYLIFAKNIIYKIIIEVLIFLDFFLLIGTSLSYIIGSFFYLLKSGLNYYFLINLWPLNSVFFLKLLLGSLYQISIFNIFKISSQGLKPLFNTFIGYFLVVILNYLIMVARVLFLCIIFDW